MKNIGVVQFDKMVKDSALKLLKVKKFKAYALERAEEIDRLNVEGARKTTAFRYLLATVSDGIVKFGLNDTRHGYLNMSYLGDRDWFDKGPITQSLAKEALRSGIQWFKNEFLIRTRPLCIQKLEGLTMNFQSDDKELLGTLRTRFRIKKKEAFKRASMDQEHLTKGFAFLDC